MTGTTSYYHFDGLGSTACLTDSAGSVTDRYEYTAYGEQLFATGSTPNPFRYVGQLSYYRDNSTSDYYVRARNYQPKSARWLSEDPLGYVDGMNLHQYVGSNPVNWLDPTGLSRACEILIKAGHFLPNTAVDEIDRWLDQLKSLPREKWPGSIGGVGCFQDKINDKIGDLFPGRTIPGMPSGAGKLSKEDAPKIVEAAYNAAVKHVQTLCKQGCTSVRIKIICTTDMTNAMRIHGTAAQLKLCDSELRTKDPFPNVIKCN